MRPPFEGRRESAGQKPVAGLAFPVAWKRWILGSWSWKRPFLSLAFIYLSINLVIDLLYHAVDPRLSFT